MTHKAHMHAPFRYNTYTVTCSLTAVAPGCRVRPFNLGFQQTEHLHNPLNEGKPIKICRDGQELPPDLGAQLCQLIEDAADRAGVPRPGALNSLPQQSSCLTGDAVAKTGATPDMLTLCTRHSGGFHFLEGAPWRLFC